MWRSAAANGGLPSPAGDRSGIQVTVACPTASSSVTIRSSPAGKPATGRLALLSQDLFTFTPGNARRLLDARAKLTVVGGAVVHCG